MHDTSINYGPEQEVKIGQHVTWVGFWTNAVLAVLKIGAGVIGRSGAMVADGVHSVSDFVTDVVVLTMIKISRKGANKHYAYGHGKYETFATMVIAAALAVVAVGLFYNSLKGVLDAVRGDLLPRPGIVAMIMAIISIAAKEVLFHYTTYWGRRIKSSSVVANAWHHRSDAITSVATLLGISGSMFLGEKWRVLDPVAALVVSVFIFVVAVKIGLPAVKELLEASLPKDLTTQMVKVIHQTPGVLAFHKFRTRRNGNRMILDFHIKVNPDIKVVEAHDIASDVERRLKERFGNDVICNIHIEPYEYANE